MIRLSVEQLHELQQSIQVTGEVNATVLPKHAFSTDKLFVAWARSVNQEEFYLAVWKNEDSWRAASRGQSRLVKVEYDQEEGPIIISGPQMIDDTPEYEDNHVSYRQGERENE